MSRRFKIFDINGKEMNFPIQVSDNNGFISCYVENKTLIKNKIEIAKIIEQLTLKLSVNLYSGIEKMSKEEIIRDLLDLDCSSLNWKKLSKEEQKTKIDNHIRYLKEQRDWHQKLDKEIHESIATFALLGNMVPILVSYN